jgi:N-acetylmuramoyl-L-alanine amidase
MMYDVVIHLGHCNRTRGATGTSGIYHGERRSEQAFVKAVGYPLAEELQRMGINAVTKLADESLPRCQVFVALHQDGSTNSSARGASVGYPSPHDAPLARLWKANYSLQGWPSGFRGDNYTRALQNYYGFRRVHADRKFLVEHGFATNLTDQAWMWDNLGKVIKSHTSTLTQWLGVTPIPPTSQENDMGVRYEVFDDPIAKKAWAMWGPIDKPYVDVYGTYVTGGEVAPNGYYGVRDAVAAGTMIQVG